MAALFNFQSLLTVLLLLICTCAYVHHVRPQLLDSHKTGYRGLFWKLARVGERLSPIISLGCFFMAMNVLFLNPKP